MRAHSTNRVFHLLVIFALVSPVAYSQTRTDDVLGQRLVREYESDAGLGSTPELDRIGQYISSVGKRVASALPSGHRYHFVLDPNPAFKSSFALPGGYIIVGGGLLALMQTEDELASALGHEIQHVELGQVDARVTELIKQKPSHNPGDLHVTDFYASYTKQQELACDLNGQKLAMKAGYSPKGTLSLLETFKALRKGKTEPNSETHPTLSERIAQAEPLANGSKQPQRPLKIP